MSKFWLLVFTILGTSMLSPVSFGQDPPCDTLLAGPAIIEPVFQQVSHLRQFWNVKSDHLFKVHIDVADSLSEKDQIKLVKALRGLLGRHRLVRPDSGYFYRSASFDIESGKLDKLRSVLIDSPLSGSISKFSIVDKYFSHDRGPVVPLPRLAQDEVQPLSVDERKLISYLGEERGIHAVDGEFNIFVVRNFKHSLQNSRLSHEVFVLPRQIEILQSYSPQYADVIEEAAAAAIAKALLMTVEFQSARINQPDRVTVEVENLMVSETADIPYEITLNVAFYFDGDRQSSLNHRLTNTFKIQLNDFATTTESRVIKFEQFWLK